eukprot:840204-Prymnesium_polylepis.2
MRQRTAWGRSASTGSVWRDPRTGTTLAPGAVQNWPTPKENVQMDSDRAMLERRMQAAVCDEQTRLGQERMAAEMLSGKKQ